MASNPPVNQIKVGCIEMAQWAGMFKDQPTTSFSLKKKRFNKETKKFEETQFLNVTDLPSIIVACQSMLIDYYKNPPAKAAPAKAASGFSDPAPF